MPEIGHIARARDVGAGKSYHKCVWHACADCGKRRWVLLKNGKPQSRVCYDCRGPYVGNRRQQGPTHWHWKGGRSVTIGGYVEVWVSPSDPFYSMAGKDGYVYEHRLVMARHLGRALDTNDEVHHRNKDKQDNRLENLEILSRSKHAFRHQDVNYHMQEISILEAEITRLRGMLNEQTNTA